MSYQTLDPDAETNTTDEQDLPPEGGADSSSWNTAETGANPEAVDTDGVGDSGGPVAGPDGSGTAPPSSSWANVPAVTSGTAASPGDRSRRSKVSGEELAQRGLGYYTSLDTDGRVAGAVGGNSGNMTPEGAGAPTGDGGGPSGAGGWRGVPFVYPDPASVAAGASAKAGPRGAQWVYDGPDPAAASPGGNAAAEGDAGSEGAPGSMGSIGSNGSVGAAPSEASAGRVEEARLAARQAQGKAIWSAAQTARRLEALGVPVKDAQGRMLLDLTHSNPEEWRQQVEDAFNEEYAQDAANAKSFFPGGNLPYTPAAEALRADITRRKAAVLTALGQHASALADAESKTMQFQLGAVQNAQGQLQQIDAANDRRAAQGLPPIPVPRALQIALLPGGHAVDQDPANPSGTAAAGGPAPGPAKPFAPGEPGYRVSADGTVTYDPARPLEGLQRACTDGAINDEDYQTMLPQAQAAARALALGQPNSPEAQAVAAALRPSTAKDLVNRITLTTGLHLERTGEGYARVLGFNHWADYYKALADDKARKLSGAVVDGEQYVDPKAGRVAQVIGNFVGGTLGYGPEIVAGAANPALAIPAALAGGTQSAAEAGAGGYDKVKDQGGTDAEAMRAYGGEALWTVPATALTLAAGPLAGKVLKGVLPLATSPFWRAAATLGVHSAANLAASTAGKAIMGEDLTPAPEDVLGALAFSTPEALGQFGAAGATARVRDTAARVRVTAEAIVSGQHPEVMRLDDIAAGKVEGATPQDQAEAARQAATLRDVATAVLKSPPAGAETPTGDAARPQGDGEKGQLDAGAGNFPAANGPNGKANATGGTPPDAADIGPADATGKVAPTDGSRMSDSERGIASYPEGSGMQGNEYWHSTVRGLIQEERERIAPSFAERGVQITRDPARKFSVRGDADGNITFNYNEQHLFENALHKAAGDPDAAAKYIQNAFREEYLHARDFLSLREEWQRRGGPDSGQGFGKFVRSQETNTGNDIVRSIEDLPPERQGKAIHDMVTLLRNYQEDLHGEADLSVWDKIKNDADVRKTLAAEAGRQLAHYTIEMDNTETGFLETLDPQQSAERHSFYARVRGEADAGLFGVRLRNSVRRLVKATGDDLQKIP